ncbi:putative flavin-nucleotide-binding protein [Frankia torreyi]|uniref:Putative flavin-nucleotide-binding protein n=1 Tax=Frankia torreyi TaxID=1856 RepID=A0A0D8BA03_9ACTN|nr:MULTISPECIES: pyridoxamine 5'-phosphate oxidase family protein [Frankia]KJE20749.1 putative flavin-nucleotide-binding protein [Frankia torreyi]KQC39922.1 DNA-binding protein [Frankia sp. ACN1ag]KQM03041.1 putative flavin-nucleotide-binding protein [Frankia sp. CpI1-P]
MTSTSVGAPGFTASASDKTTVTLDHAGGGVLPAATCLWLLAGEQVGRVAFRADGEILVLPVNYVLDGDAIAFRTATGSKLAAALEEDAVGFEVDGHDPVARAGWSVLINGRAVAVTDQQTLARLEKTGLAPWADRIEHPHWVRILPESMTGRVVAHS